MSAVLEYPQRHSVTTDEFLRMGEAGVFAPQARLELIEGEIIEMAPIGSAHAGTVNTLVWLLGRAAGDLAVISVQNPLVIEDDSVAQPDVAALRFRPDRYKQTHPTAIDVLVAIEVSDTTLRFDLETKAPLYARCAIPELWVLDLNERVIRVHREPANGAYQRCFAVSGDESVECVALPALRIRAREVL